jgi:hypothetical protein
VSAERQPAHTAPSNGAPHSAQNRPPALDAPQVAQRWGDVDDGDAADGGTVMRQN